MSFGKKQTSFRAWWGSVLLGAWVSACGPVPEGEAPEDEVTAEQDVADEASPEEVVAAGASAVRSLPTVPRTLALSGPAVAYGGGKYLVVWEDVREGGVYGARLKQDGTLADPVGFRINTSTRPGGTPAIAYDGNDFMVVWMTASDGVFGVRVKPDGTVLGPVFTVISSGEVFGPTGIACSSKQCLVTFTVEGDDQSLIGVRRVGTDGTVLPDSGGFLKVLGDSRGFAVDSSVAWNGKEFLVVWAESRGGRDVPPDIFGGRVKPDGSVPDRLGFPISTAPGVQRDPDVVWTGRRFLTVWEDLRTGNADIRAARVRSDMRVDDPEGLPIATTSAEESAPAVAHHNSKSLIVWRSVGEGTSSIRGARLTEEGELWDAAGIGISSPGRDADFSPDVAFGGSRFLTPWARASSVEERPFLVVGAQVDHDADVHRETVITRYYEPSTPNLIQNGSFESGYDGPPEFWKTLSVGETIPGGWVVTRGNLDWHDGSSPGASDGRRDVDLSGSTTGALSQTVPTTPGRTYLLTFDLAGNPAVVCGAGLKRMQLTVAGVPSGFYTYDTAPYANDFTGLRWRPEALLFTATGPETAITFESLTDSCGGPAIDNVAVRLLPPGL